MQKVFFKHNPVWNNSCRHAARCICLHAHTPSWAQLLTSFIKCACVSPRICLLRRKKASFKVYMHVDFVCWKGALETVAGRHCQGERQTSMRMNAICEFRCFIDPSGPRSLFSISIYHHLSSPQTTSMSAPPASPVLSCSSAPRSFCRSALSSNIFAGFDCPRKNNWVNNHNAIWKPFNAIYQVCII